MFWRFAPEVVWKNSLDVRFVRRLVPVFSSVRFRVPVLLLSSFSFFFPLSSLGAGSGVCSFLLCVFVAGPLRTPKAGPACIITCSSSFLPFSLCPGRLPSPLPFSLYLFSVCLSLSLLHALVRPPSALSSRDQSECVNVRSGNAPSDVFFFPFGLWQVDVLRPCWNPLWRFVRYSHCAVKLHDQVMDFGIAWGIMSSELCWQIVEMGARIPLRGRISDCNLLRDGVRLL